MKKFTIKDFILTTSPCFGCNQKLSFTIGLLNENEKTPHHKPIIIEPDVSIINLRTTYNSSLSISINHKTNYFKTNNLPELFKFLNQHQLFVSTNCKNCFSYIESQYLEFNTNKGFIKPVGISNEDIVLKENNTFYMIKSSSLEATSIITVTKFDGNNINLPIRLETPILPLYKFKNKQILIDKIKVYLLFS